MVVGGTSRCGLLSRRLGVGHSADRFVPDGALRSNIENKGIQPDVLMDRLWRTVGLQRNGESLRALSTPISGTLGHLAS